MVPTLILPRDDIEAYLKRAGDSTVALYNSSVAPLKPEHIPVTFSFFDLIDFDDVRSFLRYQIIGPHQQTGCWEDAALMFVDEVIAVAEAGRGEETSLNFKQALDKAKFPGLGVLEMIHFSFDKNHLIHFAKTFNSIKVTSQLMAELEPNMERLQYILMQISEVWRDHKERYEDNERAKLAPIFFGMYKDSKGEIKPFDVLVIENASGHLPVRMMREIPFIVGKYARIS